MLFCLFSIFAWLTIQPFLNGHSKQDLNRSQRCRLPRIALGLVLLHEERMAKKKRSNAKFWRQESNGKRYVGWLSCFCFVFCFSIHLIPHQCFSLLFFWALEYLNNKTFLSSVFLEDESKDESVKETKLPSKSGVMCESCVPAQNPFSYLVLLKTDKFSLSNRLFLPTTKVSGDMLLILVLQESQLSTWLHVSSDLRLTMFGTSFVVYECFNIFFRSYQITRDEQGSCYILLHHSVSQSPLPSPNFEISRNFRIFTTILQELNFCATIMVNFFQIVSSCAWWFC